MKRFYKPVQEGLGSSRFDKRRGQGKAIGQESRLEHKINKGKGGRWCETDEASFSKCQEREKVPGIPKYKGNRWCESEEETFCPVILETRLLSPL